MEMMLDGVAEAFGHRALTAAERAHRLDVATRLSHACGCETSGAFAAVALAASAFWLLQPGDLSLPGLGLAAAAVLVAGLIGKALGLGIARLRLRLVLRTLERSPVV